MLARETFHTLRKHKGLWYALCWFSPFRKITGRWYVMRPYWHNGAFGMRSLNKYQD